MLVSEKTKLTPNPNTTATAKNKMTGGGAAQLSPATRVNFVYSETDLNSLGTLKLLAVHSQ